MEHKYISMALMSLTNHAEYVWVGENLSDIQWITEGAKTPTQKQIDDKIAEIKANEQTSAAAKASAKAALLDRLGITAEEAAILLS